MPEAGLWPLYNEGNVDSGGGALHKEMSPLKALRNEMRDRPSNGISSTLSGPQC
jgi:hypothetical protein